MAIQDQTGPVGQAGAATMTNAASSTSQLNGLLMFRNNDDPAGQSADSTHAVQQRLLDRFLAGVEKRAYRMAVLATGNQDEAFDIVQDAMLKLVENYGKKAEADLAPLFFCILQSRIRDWYRRSSVRNRLRSWLHSDDEDDESDGLDLLPDPSARTPEDILAADGGMVALEAALAKLPLRQQQVFLLRAWEGLDVRQTAEIMQCAQGSVKTHYSRALITLREKLRDHV